MKDKKVLASVDELQEEGLAGCVWGSWVVEFGIVGVVGFWLGGDYEQKV